MKIDPAVDRGKWYDLKVQQLKPTTSVTSTPILPISGWKTFPSSAIPEHFNYGHIYHYLVDSVANFNLDLLDDGEDELDDISTAKPFSKGEWFVASGHVRDKKDSRQKDYYFVKATVQASYSKETYNTTVTLSIRTGAVKEGTCTCRVKEIGRCSHVAALLLSIEDHVKTHGNDPKSVTEQKCQWNQGQKKNKNPSAVFDVKYMSTKKELVRPRKSGTDRREFDPRPSSYRQDELLKEDKHSFLSDLHLNVGDCGWTNILEYEYDDFQLDETDKLVLKKQTDTFIDSLKDMCEHKSAPFEVSGTNEQAACDKWYSDRWCRITASICKDVACVTPKGVQGLLNRLLWDNEKVSTLAIEYGKTNEKNALKDYCEKFPDRKIHTETGLWINPSMPQLGCSPDGLVTDENGDEGLIEVKCPYVLRKTSPACGKEQLTKKQINNLCCQILGDGTLRLKREHKYFYQVQMQMAVCEKKFCDFVVWSKQGLSVERILPDQDFWKYTAPKLVRFHQDYLVPEYFMMRLPRDLPPLKINV